MPKHHFLIRNFIKRIEKDIETAGFQQAMLNLVKRTGTKLEIRGKSRHVEKVLKNHAVVIVADHQFETDPIALVASLPKRTDNYLIIDANFINFGENLDKYLIPVYINHHYYEEKNRLALKLMLLKRFYPLQAFSAKEEHQKNIKNIKEASQRLGKGSSIVMFPKAKGGKWRKGLAHLLKGAGNKREIYLVHAYIRGTTSLDYFRFLPIVRKFFPKTSVTFSPPKQLNGLLKENIEDITSKLQEDYDKWRDNLDNLREES